MYKNEMKLLINQAWDESNSLSDLSARFDYIKYKIRQFSIDYCKKRSKSSKKDKTTKLLQELTDLDCKICNETINNEELIRYNELKPDLEFIEEEIIRSRLEHIESDEKSTAFFFNASKQVYQKKTISIIKTEDGSEITDAKDIFCELENFYFNLYKSTTDKEEGTIDDELVQDDDISSVFTNEQR